MTARTPARRARRRLGEVGLPRPPAWMLAGRCAQPGVNPEAWFPERGAWTRANTGAVIACGSCPVRAACLAYAIEHGQWHGIWGGLTVIQRRRVLNLAAPPADQAHTVAVSRGVPSEPGCQASKRLKVVAVAPRPRGEPPVIGSAARPGLDAVAAVHAAWTLAGCGLMNRSRAAVAPQRRVTVHPPAHRPAVDPGFEPAGETEPFGSAITSGGDGGGQVALSKERQE